MIRPAAPSPVYQVPALEKGLDILEHLARQGVPLSQAQLARALGRGPNELFRMLVCLERRGYVQRDPLSGAYTLTLRLFELGHTHSPLEHLLRAAVHPMRALTESVLESCHLSVLRRGELLVLAQEESPRPLRLSVEVGRTFPLVHTVSGRILMAFLSEPDRAELLRSDVEFAALSSGEQQALLQRLDAIRARGYEEAQSETTEGVRDLAVLVGSPDGTVQAALAIAALSRTHEPPRDDLLPALRLCAEQIGRAAGLIHEGAEYDSRAVF
jgi:DNA-binding IclR family transcriptional regulator